MKRIVAVTVSLVLALSAVTASAAQAPPAATENDSITLQSTGLRLRLPTEGARWEERRVVRSGMAFFHLFGTIEGGREVQLQPWFPMEPQAVTCDGWVAHQESQNERLRRFGMRIEKPHVERNPRWLPETPGWSRRVWGRNACFDTGSRPLLITVNEIKDRRAIEAVRALLQRLGEAALHAHAAPAQNAP